VNWRRFIPWLPVLVFVIALLPRLWAPSPFITWDEPTWTYRSLKFLRALQVGDFAATDLSAHPGVVTMWAGSVGIAADLTTSTGAGMAWVDDLPPFDEDNTDLVRQLLPWWRAARPGVGVVTALLIAAAYMLLTRLADRWTALAGALLLAYDPYYLGHSRVLHLDAVMAGAMLCSVLAVLVYVRGGDRRHLLLAGAFGGLAVVEKSPAAFIAPFSAFILLASAPLAARRPGRAELAAGARDLVLWGLAAGVAYVVLWPAMWAAPLGTLGGMWAYATESAGRAREAVFFWGAIQPDPGLRLYLAAVPFRLTPLACLGLVATLPVLRLRPAPNDNLGAPADRDRDWSLATVVVLVAYVVLFLLFMGDGAKKFERYVLPVFPALDVVAAIGLVGLVRLAILGGRRGGLRAVQALGARGAGGALAAILVMQAVSVWGGQPYYLATYNPAIGGGPMASTLMPVGWGEGMDRVADYLNAKADASSLVVSTPSVPLLAPFFKGRTVGARQWETADYIVLYIDDVQIRRPDIVDLFHGARVPEHVIRVNGIDYAWIYAR